MSVASALAAHAPEPAMLEGFSFERPDDVRGWSRKTVHVARTEALSLHSQVVDERGASNLMRLVTASSINAFGVTSGGDIRGRYGVGCPSSGRCFSSFQARAPGSP